MKVAKKSALAVLIACTCITHAAPAPVDEGTSLDDLAAPPPATAASAAAKSAPADEQQAPSIPAALTYALLGLGMALIGLSTQWRQRR